MDADTEIQKIQEKIEIAQSFNMTEEELVPVLVLLSSTIQTILTSAPFNSRTKLLALTATLVHFHEEIYQPSELNSQPRLENLLEIIKGVDTLLKILKNKS
jgi:hypothetical protein